MHLTASLVPPLAVIQHLGAALKTVQDAPNQLTYTHVSQWRLRLGDMGNVVKADAATLCAIFRDHTKTLPPPTLRFKGMEALPEDGDDGIWIGLAGDLDIVASLAAQVPVWVRQAGFVPDRRGYRARVRLAKITPTTTVEYLQAYVDYFADYVGPAWTPEGVTLGIERHAGLDRPPGFEPYSELRFAEPAPVSLRMQA